MAIPFTDRDDIKGAYIAGSSGASEYTSSGPITPSKVQAFSAGVQSTQQNKPKVFQDTVQAAGPPTDDGELTLKRSKSLAQQQLDQVVNQDDAFDFINTLNQLDTGGTGGMGILNRDILKYLKPTLGGIGAFTTDPNEERNVYQLLINKMFQGDRDRMRGALPLSQRAVEGLKRVGPRSFVDPALRQGFLGDLGSLFTGKNKAAVNLSDLPGGGIAELPEFGQAGLDFTKEQGFKDYSQLLETLFTPAPFKLAKFVYDKSLEGAEAGKDLVSSAIDKAFTPIDELTELIDSIGDEEKLIDSIGDEEKLKPSEDKKFVFF